MAATQDRTLAAAGYILTYSIIVGFTDNFVQLIARNTGLWQFHFLRGVMALALLGGLAVVFGWRLRPVRPRAVAARSIIHGVSMLIYFGALAFLPVAMVAAGLFTSPIFVLLISRVIYGHPIGPVRVLAVGLGFAGVLLVLGPQVATGASLAAVLPVLAGALYALGNVATREWCAEETAQTLLAGFFVTLMCFGAAGMAVLWFCGGVVPEGATYFLQRGPVWPDAAFWGWTFVQAAGSLLGIGLMIRAYQITDAGRASVLEYMILPASALWTWVLWGDTLGLLAWAGIGLIVAAGAIIALRARQQEGS